MRPRARPARKNWTSSCRHGRKSIRREHGALSVGQLLLIVAFRLEVSVKCGEAHQQFRAREEFEFHGYLFHDVRPEVERIAYVFDDLLDSCQDVAAL